VAGQDSGRKAGKLRATRSGLAGGFDLGGLSGFPQTETRDKMKSGLLLCALAAALALTGCATTRTLTFSSSNPVAPTDEHGVPCLHSGGANPVTLWLLTPRFRTDPDDLTPPAFRLLVKNGGAQPFAFSPANLAASSGGASVHVYTAAEFAGEINVQAVALHRLSDQNVAEAMEKLDAYESMAAIMPAGQTAGLNGPMYDFSTVPHPDTEAEKAQVAATEKSRRDEIEIWRQSLLDGAQMMLGEHTVPPGEMAGGVVRLDPRAVGAGRTLRLVVTSGGEVHEFVFDVGR